LKNHTNHSKNKSTKEGFLPKREGRKRLLCIAETETVLTGREDASPKHRLFPRSQTNVVTLSLQLA
jgi:hypothetical protein